MKKVLAKPQRCRRPGKGPFAGAWRQMAMALRQGFQRDKTVRRIGSARDSGTQACSVTLPRLGMPDADQIRFIAQSTLFVGAGLPAMLSFTQAFFVQNLSSGSKHARALELHVIDECPQRRGQQSAPRVIQETHPARASDDRHRSIRPDRQPRSRRDCLRALLPARWFQPVAIERARRGRDGIERHAHAGRHRLAAATLAEHPADSRSRTCSRSWRRRAWNCRPMPCRDWMD